eukprot:scaffold61845_cov22-Tisochrysis_lutea.AAC.2
MTGRDTPHARPSACFIEGAHLLVGNKHIRDVLVLAKERKVQQNLERLRVSGHNDKFSNTSVKCLSGCGALAEMASYDVLGVPGPRPANKGASLSVRVIQRQLSTRIIPCRSPSLAPFFSCLKLAACWMTSRMVTVRLASARGKALGLTSA